MNETEIRNVFDRVKNVTRELRKCSEEEIQIKLKLEKAKLSGLDDGTISGKNAELREASAREALKDLYRQVEEAEIRQRKARYEWDLAQIDLDELKMMMRLTELLVV